MVDSLGTVERGKLVDLVLLDANPLDDIRNARRVRLLDRATLDGLLAKLEAASK